MPMTSMCAGDVVIRPQGFANAYRDSLFTCVKMSKAGHESAKIELIGLILEGPDLDHLSVHAGTKVDIDSGNVFGWVDDGGHVWTPQITFVLGTRDRIVWLPVKSRRRL